MKKSILLTFLVCTLTSTASWAGSKPPAPAKLKYTLEFLFNKTLEMKNLEKRDDVPMPKYFFASSTPLKQFQDALEKQWGFRPDVFTNAFAVERNEVYIMDDAEWYERNQRCMDDSVVHELVHYFQVKYQNWDLNDESLEWDAVDKQTEFRNKYCPPKN